MQTFNTPLSELNLTVFQFLIDNGVPENTNMEYKRELSFGKESEKKEFLFDVTSFANHRGGDLIFGIEEKDNVPINLIGISNKYDQMMRQIEDLLRYSVEPRIEGIQYEQCLLEGNERYIFVMRIPKSFFAPHQVSFGGHMYFYSRANNSKFRLNLFQLRNMFVESTTLTDKIKRYIQDRIYKVIENDTPAPINEEPKLIIHSAPLISFDGSNLNLSTQQLEKFHASKSPYHSFDERLNLDGKVYMDVTTEDRKNSSYFQLFRSGVIEVVDAYYLRNDEGKFIYFGPNGVDYYIEKALERMVHFYKANNIHVPIYFYLSFVNIKGFIVTENLRSRLHGKSIDRAIITLPEIVLEDYSLFTIEILEFWYALLYNASNLERTKSK